MGNSNAYYLREDAYFEPLFNQWYAWSYLVPPVTASRYLVNTHKRLMNSFLNNHELHIMAAKEKGLAGGEFLDCSLEQLPEIKALIDQIDDKHRDMVELAEAISKLDELLRNHTSGETIDPLYKKVPKALQGYVELFMDMEHRASYRLIEPLLYFSPCYKPSLQSISFGLLSKVKERPFVLSTPRLPDEKHLQAPIDFNNPLLDTLLKAREIPIEEQECEAIFRNVETRGGLKAADLFTQSPPKQKHIPVTEGVRLSFTGHAGFLIETKDVSVLIDPVIASRGPGFENEVISFSQLPPKIDYICLTHNHQDHVNLETLLQLRYKTNKVLVPKNNGGSLADPSVRLILKQLGFQAFEVDDLDEVPVLGGSITAVPFLGEHGDLNVRSKTAWYVELLGKRFFFGADSSNPDNSLYGHLGKLFNGVDVLAIGMECVGAPYTWLYGALSTKVISKTIKDTRRLNGSDFQQAFPMVKAFNAKHVYVYALGMEPWYKYFMGLAYDSNSRQITETKKLIDACKEIGIEAEALYGSKVSTFD